MSGADAHPFTRTTFFMWGGLLVWAAQFLSLYTFTAVACARRIADTRVLGFELVPFITVLVTLAALAASAVWCYRAWRGMRNTPGPDQHTRFIHFLAFSMSGIAVVAIVWTALPGLLLDPECADATAARTASYSIPRWNQQALAALDSPAKNPE